MVLSSGSFPIPLMTSLYSFNVYSFGNGYVLLLSIDEYCTIKKLDIWMSQILTHLACLLVLWCSCCCGLRVSMCFWVVVSALVELSLGNICNPSVVLFYNQGWGILLCLYTGILLSVVYDTHWGVQLCIALDFYWKLPYPLMKTVRGSGFLSPNQWPADIQEYDIAPCSSVNLTFQLV